MPHSTSSSFQKHERNTEIQDFYKGQSVFITGGTGFIGKIIVEKLLRSCPELDSIYIMIRTKKGKDVQTRLEEYLQEKVFSLLDEDQKSLVHAVQGELGLPNLGMNFEDQTLLENKVNIVIHCAANVRFDEKLKTAININVRGTLDVLNMCRKMSHLLSVVYVSTAFSNSNRTTIGECFYKPGLDPELALALARVKGGEDALKIMEPLILNGWPNTYTFTKSIAESLIRLKGADLPITIFRPSIVLGTSYQSPMTGYVDNFLGATGIFIGIGLGVLRTMELNRTTPTPLVPADLCANGIIVSAWHIANHRYAEPVIFNFVNSRTNSWTWYKFCRESISYTKEQPSEFTIWYPGMVSANNSYTGMFLRLSLHLLPATLADGILVSMGKQPQALKHLRKLVSMTAYLTRFWKTSWDFQQDNTRALVASLSHADGKLFNFDMDNFDWSRNLPTMIKGLKMYILNEPAESSAECRKRFNRLKLIHKTVKTCASVLVLYIIWGVFNVVHVLINHYYKFIFNV